MSQEKKPEIKYVSVNTVFVVGIVCLIVGFLGGVVYSTYKSGSEGMSQPSMYQAPSAPQTGPSAQQTDLIKALELKLTQNPGDQDSWAQLGNLYFDTNNPQKAIDAYTKYNELNPDNPNVWTDLGIMYRRAGQFSQAVAAFDRAIEIRPNHPQSWFNKGIVYLHNLNNPEEAIKAWEELIKIAPDFKGPGGQSIQQMVDSMKKR
ncbi:tetratricopeptide repeat protein [Acidobacteriota bacterium]